MRSDIPQLKTRKQKSGALTTYSLFSGVFLSFGPTDDPASRARYAAALLAWEQAGRRVTKAVFAAAEGRSASEDDSEEGSMTVRELAARYETFLDETGRYVKAGRPTTQRLNIARALREFMEGFADLPAARCTDAVIHQHRDRLERRPTLTRKGINQKVSLVVGLFRWGWKRGFVPKATWADIRLVEPLTRAEAGNRPTGKPKRIPTLDEIRAVVAVASRQVGAMLRLQALSGMRPGEVCAMRFEDVERIEHEGTTFGLYRVRDGKTSHHGHATSYVLPPAALAILDEFQRPGGGIVFRPSDAMRERGKAMRLQRRTPITKQTIERDHRDEPREFGERYTKDTYRHAVERACAAAGVERFVPHALRHVVATWAANHVRLGIGAAAAALSHASRSTTEHYVHRDDSLRFNVARLAERELAI
ncbi:MAG: tyrosine-type recombinase/integrase [Planctomycetota bacterium]